MDPLLLVLTVVSLLAAIGFGALAWYVLREERRRSDARVALLSSAIDGTGPDLAAEVVPVRVSSMFDSETAPSGPGLPLIKIAVGVAMALMLIVVVAMSNGGSDATESAVAAREAAPLELVSMRHARDGEKLTVSGLVRNPRGGSELRRVSAIVFAFDRGGSFVASGRAPLDFVMLEPGDESPFVVTIPGVSEVGRYRVSFRTESGIVRHVDRRADQSRLAAALHVQ
jgi:hypothetical protein